MATGKIKWFNKNKGYGIIKNEVDGKDVFLHKTEVSSNDINELGEGVEGEFDIQPSKFKEGRLDAHNFRLSKPSPGKTQGSSSSPETSKSKPLSGETQDRFFHNPYTFVPSPPRDKINPGEFAGDFDPLKCGLDHASLDPKLWTGHIPIKLTTVTPLVLPKTEGKDHPPDKPYDVLDYIPESSLRGMLRSAYEVVTNSRYGRFRNDDRLAFRMRPQEALNFIPAIIENGAGRSGLAARLYTGTSRPTDQGPNGPMYAAMLTLYHHSPTTCHGGVPKTGAEVNAEIVRRRHRRGYFFWQATQVCPSARALRPSGAPGAQFIKGRVLITNQNMRNKHDERIFFNPMSKAFDVTNNVKEAWRMRIQSYRDAHSEEDIFHRKDRRGNPVKAWEKFGDNPGETAWSPHQYQSGADELKPGDMVYARCEFDKGKIVGIADLFPVMISRELYANRPADLLDCSLKPAKTLCELSPADRLFGWTPQEGGDDAGYKSRIRVICENNAKSDTIIESFSDGALPLAILGQPKPAQGRFYVAKDAEGNPQHHVSKEQAGYDTSGGKGLRGRKQYWHHKGLEADKAKEYWHPSAEDRTQEKHNGRYQEYRRPNEDGEKNSKPKVDSQNRLIKGWIKPNTVFEASLYVQNLQSEELGALLWLLTLNNEIGDGDEKHYFRLGHGKPLGFGSVKVEIDTERLVNGCLPLGTGEDWKEKYYTAFDTSPPATLDTEQQDTCLQAFKASMVAAYNPLPENDTIETHGDEKEISSNLTSFDQLGTIFLNIPEGRAQLEERHFAGLPFISGFLQVLSGPKKDVPIHYPRTDPAPNPEGKNFDWFTANERGGGRHEDGQKRALPEVTDDKGLPYNPTKPKKR